MHSGYGSAGELLGLEGDRVRLILDGTERFTPPSARKGGRSLAALNGEHEAVVRLRRTAHTLKRTKGRKKS